MLTYIHNLAILGLLLLIYIIIRLVSSKRLWVIRCCGCLQLSSHYVPYSHLRYIGLQTCNRYCPSV